MAMIQTTMAKRPYPTGIFPPFDVFLIPIHLEMTREIPEPFPESPQIART
jgi:hypothetical protein